MDNQMEVLNLTFISFMRLNNDFNVFFVIYLPVINASMKSRPMSLTTNWNDNLPPSLKPLMMAAMYDAYVRTPSPQAFTGVTAKFNMAVVNLSRAFCDPRPRSYQVMSAA